MALATVWLPAFFKISSFCVQQQIEYRFGTSRGSLNDERMFLFSQIFNKLCIVIMSIVFINEQCALFLYYPLSNIAETHHPYF